MDREAIAALARAGIDVTLKEAIPHVGIHVDPGTGEALRIGDEVPVLGGGDAVALVDLKSVTELLAGSRVPPKFTDGPTEEYVPFFATIELTAADFCSVVRIAPDDEFERVYRLLKRRPDERRADPLFTYLQAAARLYLSLRDASRAEFEAVLARLARSARTFRMGPSSANYYEYALSELLRPRRRARMAW